MKKPITLYFLVCILTLLSLIVWKESFEILFQKVPKKSYPVFRIDPLDDAFSYDVRFVLNGFSFMNIMVFLLTSLIILISLYGSILTLARYPLDWKYLLRIESILFTTVLVLLFFIITNVSGTLG